MYRHSNELFPSFLHFQARTERVISLATRHYDFIAHTLQSGGIVLPLLAEGEDGIARSNDCANRFMRGLDLRRKDWFPLLLPKVTGRLLALDGRAANLQADKDAVERPRPGAEYISAPVGGAR
jgi:hypothetical protein